MLTALLIVLLAPFITQKALGYQSPFNTTGSSDEDFQTRLLILESRYCRKLCGFELDYPNVLPDNANCDFCQCDDNCSMYGDCCPDVNMKTVSDSESQCFSQSIKMDSPYSYRMITSCPVDWPDDDLRRRCSRPCEETDIMCYVPVTETTTGLTYRNKYCSKCKGADDTINWGTAAICYNKDIFLRAMSSVELFSLILADDTDACNIIFDPNGLPTDSRRRCIPSEKNLISSCNVTGLWAHYDADIARACSLYTRAVRKVYKNMFCRLCNGDTWETIRDEISVPGSDVFAALPLTALLQFQNTPTEPDTKSKDETLSVESRCNGSQIYDKSMAVCRDVKCADGKYLSSGDCKSYVPHNNYLGYTLCFNVTTRIESEDADLYVQLRELLANIVYSQVSLRLSGGRDDDGSDGDDAFGLTYTKSLAQVVGVNICGGNVQVSLQTQFSLISPAVRDQTRLQNYILSIVPRIIRSLEDRLGVHAKFTGKCGKPIDDGDILLFDNITMNSLRVEVSLPILYYISIIVQNARYVNINKFIMCPHVMLNGDSLEILIHSPGGSDTSCTARSNTTGYSDNSVILKWRAGNKTIRIDEYEITDGGVVVMCVEDFLNLIDTGIVLPNVRTVSSPERDFGGDSLKQTLPISTPLGVLSVVCTCVSLVFLLITFVIYSLFRELRTTGGVCNMGLVVNMFLAQVLYEFGMEQSEQRVLCSAIGALIHFFWLAVILWMNACVVQCFLKLCFPIKALIMAAGSRATFIIASVYSYGISALAVGITILTHELILGDVGYGGRICYFSTANGQTFAFLLPVGLLTVSNIVMFTVTVVKLRRKSLTSSGKDHRISLLACVKLSTISGLAWISGYLYTATSMTALAYVFTVLVGGQGFFLFLSLMINGRVIKLFQNKIRAREQDKCTTHQISCDTRL